MAVSYLVKKPASSSYFYRAMIPLDLRDELGTREFLVSLETGLFRQARKIALRLRAFLEDLLERVRSGEEISLKYLKETLRERRDKILNELSAKAEPPTTGASCPELDALLANKGIKLHKNSRAYQALGVAWRELRKKGLPSVQVITDIVEGAYGHQD